MLKVLAEDESVLSEVPALYYDVAGKLCKIKNDSPSEEVKKIAGDVAIIAMGTGNNGATTYILKDDTCIDLMYKIHARRTRGNESAIRYYTADKPSPVVHRVPAKPESLRCVLAVWCRNGGITAGSGALCVLFSVLASGFLGASPIAWTGIGVSFLTVFFSFIFGGAMHLLYCRLVSIPDCA
jgi:hypothetical protein